MLNQGLTPEAIAACILEDFPYHILGSTELTFACSCSQRQTLKLLRSLGTEELDRLIEEDSEASVTCEYCKDVYTVKVDTLQEIRASL